jgi:hypothetical protein
MQALVQQQRVALGPQQQVQQQQRQQGRAAAAAPRGGSSLARGSSSGSSGRAAARLPPVCARRERDPIVAPVIQLGPSGEVSWPPAARLPQVLSPSCPALVPRAALSPWRLCAEFLAWSAVRNRS